MSTYSLQADISTLQILQQKVIDKLIQKEESLQSDKRTFASRNTSIYSCLSDLKQSYQGFAAQCKNQWLGVYNELLQVFRRMVEVYQMKINRLEEEVMEKDEKIKELEVETYGAKYSENFMLEFWQDSAKQSKVSEWQQSSTGKRVKISEVIAENSHNCSISTPHHNSSLQEAITEEIEENETETNTGRALLEITQHLNQNLMDKYFQKDQQSKRFQKDWQNDVSPIMSASSQQQSSSREVSKSKKQSLNMMNKQNTMPLCSNVKIAKSLDSWKSQTTLSTSGMKLNQLRKSLIQRKKSDQLY